MDISGLSMSISQGKLMEQASLSVMKLELNTGKENASQITRMLEETVNPNLGNHIDTRG